MEIKIPLLNHREYNALVEYVSKQKVEVSHDRGDMGGTDTKDLMRITSIGKITNNPPIYHEVVIETELNRARSEALKGLIDVLT